MKLNKNEISNRFKNKLLEKFDSIKQAAAKLNKRYDSFYSNYFKGKSIPGGDMIANLWENGIDAKYILTGQEDFWFRSLNEKNGIGERINELINELDRKYPNPKHEKYIFDGEPKLEEMKISIIRDLQNRWYENKSLYPEDLYLLAHETNKNLYWLIAGKSEFDTEENLKDTLTKDEIELIKNIREIPQVKVLINNILDLAKKQKLDLK